MRAPPLFSALLDAADDLQPSGDLSPAYLDWLERHGAVLYPALALGVLVLIILGILQAWKRQDVDVLSKAELKREIVQELRRRLEGASPEALSKVVGLNSLKTLELLEQMEKDGMVVSHTDGQRRTVWRLKGMG